MTKSTVNQLKGAAILAVVYIHSMAVFPPEVWTIRPLNTYILTTLDQIARLSIPLFFFFSWFGLSSKHDKDPESYFRFLYNRTKKLVPLYLLWSTIITFSFILAPTWIFNDEVNLFIKFFFGQADYHLYFVPVIISLYCLYPLAKKIPSSLKFFVACILFLATLQWYRFTATWQPVEGRLLQPDQLRYLMPISWIWYAYLGYTVKSANITHTLQKRSYKLLLLIIGLIAYYFAIRNATTAITDHKNILDAVTFTRPSLLVAATIVLLLITQIRRLSHPLPWLEFFGRHSYLIYLTHTLAIRLIYSPFIDPMPAWRYYSALALFISGIAISLFVQHPPKFNKPLN